MFNSIKIKIIIWCLAIFSIVFAGLEIFLYYELEGVAIDFVDEHVRSEVDIMSGILRIEKRHGQLHTELKELSLAAKGKYGKKFSGRYYQIASVEGKILASSPSLSAGLHLPILPATAEGVFYTVDGPNDKPLRLISKSVDFGGLVLIFQVADSLTNTYRLVNSFRRIVLIIYPAVFLICAMGIFFMTKWALRPIKMFTDKISHITDKNLYERVDEKHSPLELRDLTSSFNTMLSRLEQSFERKKKFLSDASHELRTPTSVIKSYCDVMLSREREGAVYKDALTKIGVTVNRMTELINRILVISRIDSNSSELRLVRLNVRPLISDVFRLVGQAASEKGVALSMREGADVDIRADRESLFEVFTNLIENAVKYNHKGGRVDVSVSIADKFCEVSVEDTGMGIDEKDLENIFKRFYRTDASRGLTVGSGLGLSIVNAIVNAHGGHITVESEKGRGSRFKVFLPISLSA
ncbi:MAG: sensor histidine kinase [Thermodesulfobacteriota bacterium]